MVGEKRRDDDSPSRGRCQCREMDMVVADERSFARSEPICVVLLFRDEIRRRMMGRTDRLAIQTNVS
jgi:hypothetical protein